MSINVIYFADDGVPKTGLSPTFETFKLVSDLSDLDQPSITEVGGGAYKFTYAATEPVFFLIAANDLLLPPNERYVAGVIDASAATAILATPANKLATGVGGVVTTDDASRTASQATGFAVAGDIPTAVAIRQEMDSNSTVLGTLTTEERSTLTTQISNAFSGAVTVTSAVTTGGDIELVAGDDYLTANGRELTWSNSAGDWCNGDLTDATVAFIAEPKGGNGTDTVTATGAVVTATGTQVVSVDMAAVNSILFTMPGTMYIYHLTVTKSGYTETIGVADINVTLPI